MAADLRLASSETGVRPPGSLQHIRVVLGDDHAMVRRTMRLLLDDEHDIDVSGEGSDLSTTLRQVRRHRPHVLVLDLRLPSGSTLEVVRRLRTRAPETEIVVLTMEESPQFAQQAMAAGAIGCVLKDRADSDLVTAVRLAASGKEYVSPRVRGDAGRHARPPMPSS